MPRPCPYCGDPLSREATRGPIGPLRLCQRQPTPRWFYTCETCGREYHGVRVGDRLQLVPLSDLDDTPALAPLAWGDDDREKDDDPWPY